MIDVYKIGLSMYKHGDKNSGLFEYNIIKKELSRISTDKKVLVIINGKCASNELEKLYELLKLYDIKIFIASDIVAITENAPIIARCDCLLHQCPSEKIEMFNAMEQHYSWVPELFYKYCKYKTTSKYNKMIFGGGLRDNEDKILEYLAVVPSTAYIKTTEHDSRLEYADYLLELSKHKFALIISRKAYSDIGWVTARYAEAVANGVIPLCDKDYDKDCHFVKVTVTSAKDLHTTFNMLLRERRFRNTLLSIMRKELHNTKNNFKQLIVNLIGDTK